MGSCGPTETERSLAKPFFVQGLPFPAPRLPPSAEESVSAGCVLPSCGHCWNTPRGQGCVFAIVWGKGLPRAYCVVHPLVIGVQR